MYKYILTYIYVYIYFSKHFCARTIRRVRPDLEALSSLGGGLGVFIDPYVRVW